MYIYIYIYTLSLYLFFVYLFVTVGALVASTPGARSLSWLGAGGPPEVDSILKPPPEIPPIWPAFISSIGKSGPAPGQF